MANPTAVIKDINPDSVATFNEGVTVPIDADYDITLGAGADTYRITTFIDATKLADGSNAGFGTNSGIFPEAATPQTYPAPDPSGSVPSAKTGYYRVKTWGTYEKKLPDGTYDPPISTVRVFAKSV
jgi:hypothetical protein